MAVQECKLTKAINLSQDSNNVDSPPLPDGTITTDPTQKHNRLRKDYDHECFLIDDNYFKSIVAKISDKIQTAAIDSIGYGISQVPKRPQLCIETDDIFKGITEEEFNTVIAIAPTNTAPSPTGLTFNMIKK